MILGLIAGEWLKRDASTTRTVLWLFGAGIVSLAAGYLLDRFGICPSVKRIWTPAWTLYSGGWCFLMLAGFFGVVDGLGWRAAFFPLIVIGMNSIAIYVMVHLMQPFLLQSLRIHLGQDIFTRVGETWQPFATGGALLLVFWLILYWMYRSKIFVRI
jgi:predicted acyltransferase